MKELKTLKAWLVKQAGLKRKQGYMILYEGDDTGKFARAESFAKELKKGIHRVNVSQVVSKYIGETEKNLTAIFKEAEEKNLVLFFDEANALFGKRTTVKDSHDRHANREVKYIMERLAEYPGVIIMSTNLKKNIDSAFLRRLHAIVQFPTA